MYCYPPNRGDQVGWNTENVWKWSVWILPETPSYESSYYTFKAYSFYFLDADSKYYNHFGWKCIATPQTGVTKLAEILKMSENGPFEYVPKHHHMKAVNKFSQIYFYHFWTLIPKMITILAKNV